MAALLTTDNYVQKGSDLSNFKINFSGLEAGSSAQLEVHSTPTSLGAYTVGETGQLSVSVPVPDNLPAGYHTLHLIGKTTSGEDVDLWQIIEVRGRAGDIDEDGIPDDIDPCIYVPASGLDVDEDGIDDACDAEIGEPPEKMLAYQDKVAAANSLRVHTNRPLQMESNVDHFAIVPMMDFANENAAPPTAGSSVQDLRSASPVGSIVVSVVAAAGLAGLTWFIWVKIKNRKYYEK